VYLLIREQSASGGGERESERNPITAGAPMRVVSGSIIATALLYVMEHLGYSPDQSSTVMAAARQFPFQGSLSVRSEHVDTAPC